MEIVVENIRSKKQNWILLIAKTTLWKSDTRRGISFAEKRDIRFASHNFKGQINETALTRPSAHRTSNLIKHDVDEDDISRRRASVHEMVLKKDRTISSSYSRQVNKHIWSWCLVTVVILDRLVDLFEIETFDTLIVLLNLGQTFLQHWVFVHLPPRWIHHWSRRSINSIDLLPVHIGSC